MTGTKLPAPPSPDVMEVWREARRAWRSGPAIVRDEETNSVRIGDREAAATVIAEAKARWEREALERAAQVAEAQQMLAKDGYDLTGFYGENFRCRTTAALIRALKGDEQ